jgi:hypothetical protein
MLYNNPSGFSIMIKNSLKLLICIHLSSLFRFTYRLRKIIKQHEKIHRESISCRCQVDLCLSELHLWQRNLSQEGKVSEQGKRRERSIPIEIPISWLESSSEEDLSFETFSFWKLNGEQISFQLRNIMRNHFFLISCW